MTRVRMVRCLVMLRISVFPKSTREPLRDLKQVVDMVALLFLNIIEKALCGAGLRGTKTTRNRVFSLRGTEGMQCEEG